MTLFPKNRFLKAIQGSGGIRKVIAERLGCSPQYVQKCLSLPDWEDVRRAYEEEVENTLDLAESTVLHAIADWGNMALASQNARWYLSRRGRHRGYGDQQKVEIEGGMKMTHMHVPVDVLNLPPRVKRQLLVAIEQMESEDEAVPVK